MEDHSDYRAPPVPKEWRSANQLRRAGYAGGVPALNCKLMSLRTALIGDIVAAGMGEADAIAVVDANLIGRKKPSKGREAIYGSPEALAMLNLVRSEKFNINCPPVQEEWWTANQLAQAGYRNDARWIKRQLMSLRTALIGDIVAAGMGEADAIAVVDANLIGRKRPHTGPSTYYATLDAIRILETEGRLKHRWDDELVEKLDLEENSGRSR